MRLISDNCPYSLNCYSLQLAHAVPGEKAHNFLPSIESKIGFSSLSTSSPDSEPKEQRHRSSTSKQSPMAAFSASTTTAYLASFASSNQPSSPLKPFQLPLIWPWQKVKMGPMTVSPMGFGTWAWGNQLLWGYDQSMDADLQRIFNLAVGNGINLFDTADSYGTGKLNGQSEKLLGKFIREYPGKARDDIVIATKFAAYPWRLTPGQFVKACK
ncbi:unnamed protein product [Linum tenue]|nr:unnamed protein product [Linum tenue]